MAIEVVESRSDDDTCSCSCSAAPSEADEEIRDGSVSGDEIDSSNDGGNNGRLKAVVKTVPDSIPEEPTPSIEETEFSSGTQGTATTVTTEGTEGTEASIQRNEKGQETSKGDNSTGKTDLGGVNNDAAQDDRPTEDDRLLNVPSDESVFAGVEQSDCGTDKLTNAPSDEAKSSSNTTPIASNDDAQSHHDRNEKDKKVQAQRNDVSLARRQWENAVASLKANPSLMTADILKLALHNRPPLDTIKFMIGLNPDAAGVPRQGPSALQIAVRHHASIEVVEEVIRACPYALFTGNGTYDPLTYAKIWRRDEAELIKVLERPISYWVTSSGESSASGPASLISRERGERKREVKPKKPSARSSHEKQTCSEASHRVPDPPAFPDKSCPSPPSSLLRSPSKLTKAEQRELSNIKLITAAIVKAQKKQMAEADQDKRDTEAKLKFLAKSEARARHDMVMFVDERIQKTARAHLVAIDMKERAFESRIATIGKDISDMLTESTERQEHADRERDERDEQVRKTVEGAMSTMKEEILAAADRVDKATASYGTKLAELAVRVDTESVANAAFRNDIRQRQGDLEERIEGSFAASCFVSTDQNQTEDTSFEVESIPATNSTDHLFSDDFGGGIDETCIVSSKSSGDFDYPQSQIQDSFSSEWNSSRRGLVVEEKSYHTDASWWKSTSNGKKKRRRGGWKRWLKVVRY